jgi:hypothetical protein
MSYGPVTVGETFPLYLSLVLDSGAPLPLGGVQSLALVFKPAAGSPGANARFQATGTVAITDANNGKGTFFPSPQDSAALRAGQWSFQPVVTYVGGAVRFGRALPLEVVEAL